MGRVHWLYWWWRAKNVVLVTTEAQRHRVLGISAASVLSVPLW